MNSRRNGYLGGVDDDPDVLPATAKPAELAREEELPVVARLVVEIRSDGTRTVARGALEDRATGQQVGIQAEGTSPLALATTLAKSIFSLPAIAAKSFREATTQRPRRRRPSLRRALRGALGRRRDDDR